MTVKGLKLLSLNVRSLYTNLNELYARFNDFDVLCFCETWLNNSYNDQLISMDGFEIFRLDREKGNLKTKAGKNKRGGGLIFYVKKDLAQHTKIIENISTVTENIEQLWISIGKPNNGTKIIASIYRPPSGNLQMALKELTNSSTFVQDNYHGEMTLMGDFNVDYKARNTPAFKLLKTFERDFNLTQLIKVTTRPCSKTCLDLIFTNMDYINASGILNINISDHLPVFIIKKKSKNPSDKTNIRCRSYVNYDKQKFQENIKRNNKWRDFWNTEETNPDKMWKIIEEIIEQEANQQCPFKDVKINDNTPNWLNKELLSEINHKDHLYRKAKKTNNPGDWDLFKKKKNEVKKLLATAKDNFVKNKLNEAEGNPRKFWRTINNISGLGKNKKNRKCTKIIDEMGKTHENLEAAAFLNDFYVNVGPSLAKKHDQKWVKENCKINVTASFNFSWVTEFEVKRLVKEICITKSSAIDNINTKLLKDAFEVLTFELTYLYNCCLQTGTFPNSWGLSKVTPIPKTNTNSTKAADWRPISQIPLPGKLLEKIIHAQLSSYIEMNNILSKNQYGFRKDLSTSIAIFDVLKVLFENWNDKKYSGCVFIDFSRAFDSIDHCILMEKLKLYGLDETPLNFVKSYMSCRKQTTTVNGFSSPQLPVTYGTAQGSILGPLIFILYVNDIFETLEEKNSVVMYADDTLLISRADNINEVSKKAQKALQSISKWCHANKLSINLAKTKYMVVKHDKLNNVPELELDGCKINTVHQYEYLGMIMDDKLAMNNYLDVTWKKTNAKIGILAKIRRYISEKTATRIYKSMIRPHLDYIDFVIESGSADRINKLNNIQKKAIRRIEYCVTPENRIEIKTLQEKYDIEDLNLRRKRNIVKIMYAQSTLVENKKEDYANMTLRSSKKVKMKNNFTDKTKVYNSPHNRGLRLWNELPPDLQKEKDKHTFKKHLKSYKFK